MSPTTLLRPGKTLMNTEAVSRSSGNLFTSRNGRNTRIARNALPYTRCFGSVLLQSYVGIDTHETLMGEQGLYKT